MNVSGERKDLQVRECSGFSPAQNRYSRGGSGISAFRVVTMQVRHFCHPC